MFWLAIAGVLAALAATMPLRWAAGIVVACLPLSGTAVFMLGGDPLVLPLVVTLGFLGRHGVSLLSKPLREQFLALTKNEMFLLAFAGYCTISGLLFPRLFAGETAVIPQSGQAIVLGPGQTSIVQIAYLLLGVWLYLALRQTMLRKGLEFIIGAILVQIGLFAGYGVVQALLGMAHVPVSTAWIVNNQGYALLTQERIGGFARVTSVFVEASAYATWATGAAALCYALYINRVLPVLSLGMLALVGVTLLLSTSSTAYVGLLVVGLFAVLYAFLDGDRKRHERGLMVVLVGVFLAVLALIFVYSAQDGLLAGLRTMIEDMTVRKGSSNSGLERARWAQSAVQNALDTGLLGVGYGAARSSGLIYQLFGAIGAPGLVLFALAMAALARRVFRRPRTGEDAVVSSGAFALCCTIAAMSASSPDLALPNMFWVYAAIAAAPVAQRAAVRMMRQGGQSEIAEPAPSSAQGRG